MTFTGPEQMLLDRVRSRCVQLPPPSQRRRIREDAHVSLRELARALGVTHAAIRNWEAGKGPGQHKVTQYANLLAELERITRRPA